MALNKAQAADLDEVLETLSIEQAKVAERRASAMRTLERLNDEYSRIVASMAAVRRVRG